ncbi:mycofactocin-coupled SDR family oxidoreductase [Streptomyces flaveolus]|uniref:mycofactocin-coupled SDR family oxidoreductase n=1 Tax=Streptomyces flaveolus TaxID=67297 RepID=UPI0038176899
MGRVDGKVVVITGAARGMGRNHAVRLAEEGADLILLDACAPMEPVSYAMAGLDELKETARLVEKAGRRAFFRQVDVRDRAGLKGAIDAGVEALGGLDVVVANAGVLIYGTWDSITEEAWDTTVDVDLKGVFNTCQFALPHLLARGGHPSIINISSAAGVKGQPLTLPYTAAKWGVTGLTASLANELADQGVRANSIHPTGVPTGIDVPGFHELLAEKPHLAAVYQNAIPVPRVDLDDISNAVVFLASDESRYVTGLQFKVDAGVGIR